MLGWIRRTWMAATSLADAAYRLGRLDRATRHYQPQASSGDGAALGAADLMHRRARDQVRNNPHCKRASDAWQDLLVGTGLQTLADPFEPWLDLTTITPQDLDERLSYALEADELHAEWWLSPEQFSANGRMAGADFQRLLVAELVATGNAFVIECWRKNVPPGQVPLCYQLLEYEHLDRSISRPGGNGQNRVIEGIEIDAAGREVAYYLFQEHPHDPLGLSVTSSRVEATRCTHVVLPSRPSQHHGVTWLHAAGQPEIDRDKLISSELQTAAKVAKVALALKQDRPNPSAIGILSDEPVADDYGNSEVRLGDSPVAVILGKDDDLKVVESTRPNQNVEEFLRVLDRTTSGGLGLSYYTLTGDYASTAYSSVRAARQDEDSHVQPLQQWFGLHVAIPMRKRFNAVAAAFGLFSTVTPAEVASNPRRYQRFEAMGTGRDLLDPDAETTAAIGRLRAGLSNLKIECARRGLHWVRVLRQIKLENQLLSVLGVVLDFSKGQGGQVTQTTRDGSRDGSSQQQGASA